MFYHLRLSTGFLRSKELFNLNREQLEEILEPWRRGEPLLLGGRRWLPDTTKLTVYEGPALTANQRALGQGWSNAIQFGEDVTGLAVAGRLPTPAPPPPYGATLGEEQFAGSADEHASADPHSARPRRIRLRRTVSKYSGVAGGLLAVAGGLITALIGVSSVPAVLTVVVVLAASVFGAAFIHDRSDRSHLTAYLVLVTACFGWLAIWASGSKTTGAAQTHTVVLQGASRPTAVSMRVTISQPASRFIQPGARVSISGSSTPLPAGGVLWLIANENGYFNAMGVVNVSGSGEWSTNQTIGTKGDHPGMHYELLVVLVLNAEQDASFAAAADIFNEGTELTGAEVLPYVVARRSLTGR